MKSGFFNQRQLKVLRLRAKGYTQLETANELGTTRANVSMIEWRARKKLERARQTLDAYEAVQSSHTLVIEKGTKLAEVPPIVLHKGDKLKIHVRSDLVEIIKLVRGVKPNCVADGKLSRNITFRINERGKLDVSQDASSPTF